MESEEYVLLFSLLFFGEYVEMSARRVERF